MARWEHTVLQKRVLTLIIAALQKEIFSLSKGVAAETIPLFSRPGAAIPVKLLMQELVLNGNNHSKIHNAILAMREIPGGIHLPEVKGSGRQSRPAKTLHGFIEGAEFGDYRREVTFWIPRGTMAELVNPGYGLTAFSEHVMRSTNSRYTQRIYELICHWRDKGVLSMSLDRLRDFLSLGDRYPTASKMINKVIIPVQEELLRIGDTYFHMGTTRNGAIITHINFAIKIRLSQRQQQHALMRIREQVTNILRIRFGFREDHFRQIGDLLADDSRLRELNGKVGELWSMLDRRNDEITNTPAWALQSLKQAFGGENRRSTAIQKA
jgi:hypothetical protein